MSVSLPDSKGINLTQKNGIMLGRPIIPISFRCNVLRA